MRLVILLLVTFIALVNSHAVLLKPTPFSSNPSTARPCGGGVPQTSKILGKVCINQVNSFDWKIVVNDGYGNVRFSLSSNNNTNNFDILIGESTSNPTAVGTYSLNINVPNIKPGYYLMKANSTTNWNSCSYVDVTTDCTEEVPTTEKLFISQGSGVDFCSMKVSTKVVVPVGTVLDTYDSAARSVFIANMANPNVIGTNTSECGEKYKPILCDVTFPLASNGNNNSTVSYTVTEDECNEFVDVCGVKTHVDLYPCAMFLQSSSGSLLSVSALLSILVLSIALLF